MENPRRAWYRRGPFGLVFLVLGLRLMSDPKDTPSADTPPAVDTGKLDQAETISDILGLTNVTWDSLDNRSAIPDIEKRSKD